MDQTLAKIKALIEPVMAEQGIFRVDVELRGQRGSRFLGVYADTVSGITMAEITRLTREINDLLDMHDLIEGKYLLEVSSPGVNRPLKQLWEFQKNIGRMLRVVYKIDDEELEAVGMLVSADEASLVLKVKKDEVRIPLTSIVTARVQLKW